MMIQCVLHYGTLGRQYLSDLQRTSEQVLKVTEKEIWTAFPEFTFPIKPSKNSRIVSREEEENIN